MLSVCGASQVDPENNIRVAVDPGPQQPAGYDSAYPGSAMGTRVFAVERCSDPAEPLGAELASVWVLVCSIPAPRCDHRQHEDPALA